MDDAATFKDDFGRSTFGHPCEGDDPCNGDFECDGDCAGRMLHYSSSISDAHHLTTSALLVQ